MHPAAQISMAVVCVVDCSRSSGARYQSVTTRGVIARVGSPNRRANPKSAISNFKSTSNGS